MTVGILGVILYGVLYCVERNLLMGNPYIRPFVSEDTKILCSPHRHKLDGAAEVSMDETLNLHNRDTEMLGSIPKCRMQGVAEGVVTATSGVESL